MDKITSFGLDVKLAVSYKWYILRIISENQILSRKIRSNIDKRFIRITKMTSVYFC